MKLDSIIRGATILTLDRQRPTAHSMGILDGRIAGFDEELEGCTAESIDDFAGFGGATIVPGFIDAHCHTTWWGLGLSAVDLDPARGLDALYALLARETARLADEPDEWVKGTGFNHKHHDGRFPDIRRLDEITGERPMYLRHVSGHLSITNSATLRLAGVFEPGFTNPLGGAVLRGSDGYPTGVIEESAQSLIQNLLLPYSVPQIVQALDDATTRYAEQGITSFTEAGIGAGWIGHSPIEVQAYQQAHRDGRLHARAQLMPTLDALRPLTSHPADMHGTGHGNGIDLGISAGFGNDWLSLGPVKVFMDGSLLGATAAVTEDYCGHPHNSGYLLDSPQSYRERVTDAYRAGWPIALHAIGDAAIDLAAEIIIECQDTFGRNALPNRIEHFGISRPDQVALVARAGIAVTPQAGFIGPLGDQFAQLVGSDRESWLYRGQSLVDAGVIVAGSSDLPVADNNVRRALQSSVDRKTENGLVLGGPEEGLTPEDALRCYTEGAATATGTIDSRGTLARGKLADFVVLSGSPLTATDIGTLDIIATGVDGRFSFDSRALTK
ncbi:amidohydrolase [Cryobacterium zhongshanensis]|uniref:Amidohydrolase n=1 Tax=Cryobacterium zhongshanensis TaxID=2928153 RepID=A0AA41QVR5_9MICO|nr:amidohydrolase [Cryobacterium zhongshanensis]MCI4658571.1 amidohydrolase [Cryobacterium zhongshanensis]